MAYKENMTLSERLEALQQNGVPESSILECIESLEKAAGISYDEVKYVDPKNPNYPYVATDDDTDEEPEPVTEPDTQEEEPEIQEEPEPEPENEPEEETQE